MNYVYMFTGIVHPERADVNIYSASAKFGGGGPEGELHYSILRSKIAANFCTSSAFSSPARLRYLVESAIRAGVDTLGFTNGCGYDVEIIQVVDAQTNEHFVLGVEDATIAAMKIGERLPVNRVVSLHSSTVFGPYLQRAFGDMREAIRTPFDTGFFCYRALECLVHYFMFEHTGCSINKRQGWESMRATLDLDGDDLLLIKRSADPQRHGNVKEDAAVPRELILTKTWGVVERFTSYAIDLHEKKR